MSAIETLLGEGTKGHILEELLEGGKSTRELATHLKIRESAVRMHLERMVEMGLLSSSFHREGIGRPRKKFFLTNAGHEIFARRYDMALDTMVETLIDREGESYVKSLFHDMGKRMAEKNGSEMPPLPANASKEEKLQALVGMMTILGQQGKVIRVNGETCIESFNCLFRTSAVKHPKLFCDAMHKSLVEKALAPGKVEIRETIAKGNKRCLIALS